MNIFPVAVAYSLLLAPAVLVAADDKPPFNLVVKQTDGNTFPINPTWKAGVDTPDPVICNHDRLVPDCNDEGRVGSGTDNAERAFLKALFNGKLFRQTCEIAWRTHHLYPGHVNLGFATFYGGLDKWDGVSTDADYDIDLNPEEGGLTTANTGNIHTEFDSDETFNQLNNLTPWWKEYHRRASVFPPDAKAMNRYLRDGGPDTPAPLMVVSGLLGLDCEHGCYAELHPVYAMAIRRPPEGNYERWAFFIRNWGSEGWCSREIHAVNGLPEMSILLPYPKATPDNPIVADDVTGVVQIYQPSARTLWQWLVAKFRGVSPKPKVYKPESVAGGVKLSFRDLPSPDHRPIIEGEVRFRFTSPVSPAIPPPSRTPAVTPEYGFEAALKRLEAKIPSTSALFRTFSEQAPAEGPIGPSRLAFESRPEAGPTALSVEAAPTPRPTSRTSGDARRGSRASRMRAHIEEVCRAVPAAEKSSEDYREVCGNL